MEIFNAGNVNRPPQADLMAKLYAEAYGLAVSSGTDTHFPNNPFIGGITVSKMPESIHDVIAAIRDREATLITPDTL